MTPDYIPPAVALPVALVAWALYAVIEWRARRG